ncbi:Uncharacterised protein [Mycobacteroides abscessus subsp. abscessus]|uniref:hypothetical protein n=1 Tax=Mycobacteroides abscessus TaxID=36809 RepID=UPI0009A5DD89|nr:hypothetical protein [Mycobacteroides abscessus]SLJ23444.1 Uncharacterised protein [Mycobacteroides abscessus subsp. abscessus]
MSGDEDKQTAPDIQVTKATADAGIAAIRGAAPKLVAAADSGASLLDEVIKALSVPIGDEGPIEVPTGGADVLRSQGAALETALGSMGDDVQAFTDKGMTIQTDGAKGVEKAGSGGGTFAGVTATGSVDVGATASGSTSVGEIDYSKVK